LLEKTTRRKGNQKRPLVFLLILQEIRKAKSKGGRGGWNTARVIRGGAKFGKARKVAVDLQRLKKACFEIKLGGGNLFRVAGNEMMGGGPGLGLKKAGLSKE